MISPNTPPGTEVICIDDDPDSYTYPNTYYLGDLDGLMKGEIYTVKEIIPAMPAYKTKSEYEVVVHEIHRIGGRGFAIERFRYLDIAKLDSLLKLDTPVVLKVPVKERAYDTT